MGSPRGFPNIISLFLTVDLTGRTFGLFVWLIREVLSVGVHVSFNVVFVSHASARRVTFPTSWPFLDTQEAF